jgi:hypothetical protein
MNRVETDVVRFRRRVRVERLHYTHTVLTPYTSREEFHYLYSGHEGLTVLPLFWRLRRVQSNMTATGCNGEDLPTIPSALTYRYSAELLRQEFDSFVNTLQTADRPAVKNAWPKLEPLTRFNRSSDERSRIEGLLRTLLTQHGSNPAFSRFWRIASRLLDYYAPVVQVPANYDIEFLEIHQGVDLNTPLGVDRRARVSPERSSQLTLVQWVRFITWGKCNLELPLHIAAVSTPPWHETNSVHAQLNLPEGLHVDGPPAVLPKFLFEGTSVQERTDFSSSYSYSYISADDARTVQSRIDDLGPQVSNAVRKRTQLEKRLGSANATVLANEFSTDRGEEATLRDYVRAVVNEVRLKLRLADSRRPRVKVTASVDNGLRLLALLLWSVVGIGYGLSILHWLGVSVYIELFSSFLVVTLTVALYALDKPYLRAAVSGQVAITETAFFELALLTHFLG